MEGVELLDVGGGGLLGLLEAELLGGDLRLELGFAGGSLLDGITAAVVFPALLSVLAVVCILVLKRSRRADPLPAPDRP